jgi:2-enoate reductase
MKQADHMLNNDQSLRVLLDESNVSIMAGTKVLAIKDDGIEIENDGKKSMVSCTAVVLACGYKANNSLAEKLESKIDMRIIGDSIAPRKVICAVHEGFHAARVL